MFRPLSEFGFSGLVLVLLAGGRSTRFGGPKLLAPLAGQPLAYHAATMLAALPFGGLIAVTGPNAPDLEALGYKCLPLDPPDAPQARSLAQGVEAARAIYARKVLVALADMPLVPESHIRKLVTSCRAVNGSCVGTSVGGIVMPPAIFGSGHFRALTELEGDRGGASLLADAPTVPLDPDLALDIDHPVDLARAEALLAARAT